MFSSRPPRRSPLGLPLASALCASALLCACDVVPVILPPPFGPTAGTPPRLFFPTGLAVAPSGQLLVANGNYDQRFNAGTIVSLDGDYISGLFDAAPADPSDPAQPVAVDIPAAEFKGAVMIGNYAGPLTIDQSGVRAFTGSRDTSLLNGVQLDPTTGALSCLGGTGASDVDCRGGFLDTGKQFNLLGPYAIVPGISRLPGTTTDVQVLFVSPLIPHIDGSISNTIYTSAPMAALNEASLTTPLWVGDVSNDVIAGGIGGGPMVFDAQRRQLVLGGCYTRYTGQAVGEPSVAKCGSTRSNNLIRFIGVDEGSSPNVEAVDISSSIASTDTEDLALGNYDPANGFARTLYAITRTPDLLVEVALPEDPTQLVQVTRATSMPIAPSAMLRLQRPATLPGPDLIAVSGELSDTVTIYDSTAGQVVGQIENVGISPYTLVQLPVRPGDTTARLAVSVFESCRIALIDVNFARPWEVRLRARLGSCPQ